MPERTYHIDQHLVIFLNIDLKRCMKGENIVQNFYSTGTTETIFRVVGLKNLANTKKH